MANILPNNKTPSETTAKLYLNEKVADVHFVFDVNGETQKVPANKAILAVLSPVFDAMFFGSLKESKEVKIVDASAEAFTRFLQFFYLDNVTLTIENIETVARLADKYDILDRVNACAAFIESQLTPDNMCWSYQLAIFLKNEKLIEFCEKNISRSPKEMFASEEFYRCDENTLKHILRLNLFTCSQTDVFNACVEWGKNACKQDGLDENRLENVKVQLGDHFRLIRFGDMTTKEFIEIHKLHKDLFTSDEFQDIMLQITSTDYEPKIFNENPRYYVWNHFKALECYRLDDNDEEHFVQSVEVVSFSTNQPVLLGYIWSSYTSSIKKFNGFEVDVSVIQLEDYTFHSNVSSKELYNGTFNTWTDHQLSIVFPNPILIKPKTIYEIRVTKKTPEDYAYNGRSILKAKLEDGLEIYFHRNPSLGYDNASTDWIETLNFNKI